MGEVKWMNRRVKIVDEYCYKIINAPAEDLLGKLDDNTIKLITNDMDWRPTFNLAVKMKTPHGTTYINPYAAPINVAPEDVPLPIRGLRLDQGYTDEMKSMLTFVYNEGVKVKRVLVPGGVYAFWCDASFIEGAMRVLYESGLTYVHTMIHPTTKTFQAVSTKTIPRSYDSILIYTKGPLSQAKYNPVYVPAPTIPCVHGKNCIKSGCPKYVPTSPYDSTCRRTECVFHQDCNSDGDKRHVPSRGCSIDFGCPFCGGDIPISSHFRGVKMKRGWSVTYGRFPESVKGPEDLIFLVYNWDSVFRDLDSEPVGRLSLDWMRIEKYRGWCIDPTECRDIKDYSEQTVPATAVINLPRVISPSRGTAKHVDVYERLLRCFTGRGSVDERVVKYVHNGMEIVAKRRGYVWEPDNSIALDLRVGFGGFTEAAERLGVRWIANDLSPSQCYYTQQRLKKVMKREAPIVELVQDEIIVKSRPLSIGKYRLDEIKKLARSAPSAAGYKLSKLLSDVSGSVYVDGSGDCDVDFIYGRTIPMQAKLTESPTEKQIGSFVGNIIRPHKFLRGCKVTDAYWVCFNPIYKRRVMEAIEEYAVNPKIRLRVHLISVEGFLDTFGTGYSDGLDARTVFE